MKINCCIIVRDDSELASLSKAVESVIRYVDGVYITATSKPSREIKKYCEFAPDRLHYSFFKWCDDFAAARTFNFAQAPQDSDYLLWIDSDDVLIGGERLQEVAQTSQDNGKDIVFFTYWYGCAFNGEATPANLTEVHMEQMRERLLKPGVTRWMGRLHETPVPVSGAKNNYTSYPYEANERPLVVMHTSTDEGLEGKMLRNKRILEAQLEDERKRAVGADPRTLLYLMKIYAEMFVDNLWEKVIPMGEEYLTKSGWNEERATCLEQMGIACVKMGRDREAIHYFHQAIEEWPHQPLIQIRLATAYFNAKNYRAADFWMKQAAAMDIDNKGSNLTNIKAMKLMYAELLVKMNWNASRDTKKSLEAARLLYREAPTQTNADQVEFIENVDRTNDACRNFDELTKYLDLVGEGKRIVPLLDALPDAIGAQPFAQKLRNKFAPPRTWGTREICYFANFGGAHFEKWDYSSLNRGIGGSETAVLKLAQEWTTLGYKVTIYGDPLTRGLQNGVTFLPWYYFNPRDNFNIVIQWRNAQLATKIKCRKFYIDLHDIFAEVDYSKDALAAIDKIMVKSQYHRSLAPKIPDSKFAIIGNGVAI